MPTSLKLVIVLPYLISLYDPPALALQIGPEKNVGRDVGHGHRVDSRQGLCLAARSRGKRRAVLMYVCCAVAALAASFLLQIHVHSTQMA